MGRCNARLGPRIAALVFKLKYGSRLVAKCRAVWYEIFRLVDDGPIGNKNIATELPTIRELSHGGPKLLGFPLQLAQIGARFGVRLLTRLLVKLFGAPLGTPPPFSYIAPRLLQPRAFPPSHARW
jgi:hypothetical protein